MKLTRLLLALLIVLALFAVNSFALPADSVAGQAAAAPDAAGTMGAGHDMSTMGAPEIPPEAFQRKPIPKEGITLMNLPWDVPWGGIFFIAFLLFAPFVYMAVMGIYKSIKKKNNPPQNQ